MGIVIHVSEMLSIDLQNFYFPLFLQFPKGRQISVQIISALMIPPGHIIEQLFPVIQLGQAFHIDADGRALLREDGSETD